MTVYDIVTDKIMELLEQGEIPWRKPWKSSGGPNPCLTLGWSILGISGFFEKKHQ
jgi:hypothetical protein